MKTMFHVAICLATLSHPVFALGQAPAGENRPNPPNAGAIEQKQIELDLEKLQGQWESKDHGASSPASGIVRATRRVEGKKNTVTFFNKDGEVMHEHWSDLELVQSGPVRLYLYRIREVTAGPQKGQTQPAGPTSSYSSYVYKFEGNDKHYEIVGAIANDSRPPTIVVWSRMNDK